MLLRIFKGNNPGVIVLIALIAIALWYRTFTHPELFGSVTAAQAEMPLYMLLGRITGASFFARQAIAFATMAVIALLLVNFNTSSFFINERTYLPALLYVLSAGYMPGLPSLNPALPASLFLMLAIMRIVEGYRKPGLASDFFDAGFLISTGSLFYASLIWFGLLILIGIIIIRTLNFPEVLITIIGLIAPYLMTFGIYFALDMDLAGLGSLIKASLFSDHGTVHYPPVVIAAMGVTSVIVLLSLMFLIGILNTKKIKSRNTFSLLIWTFLIATVAFIVLPPVSVEMIWLSAIPVSYFLAHYFVFVRKKLMPEIYFTLIFLSVLAIQVFGSKL